jgi:hypothetical protein
MASSLEFSPCWTRECLWSFDFAIFSMFSGLRGFELAGASSAGLDLGAWLLLEHLYRGSNLGAWGFRAAHIPIGVLHRDIRLDILRRSA